MVASLDGFIAKKDNSVSWMQSTDHYEKGKTLTDKEIANFLDSIDCYVMGSPTYEHALVLGWPYGDIPVIVLTKRASSANRKNVDFYTGDLHHLVHHQLKPNYSNIWVVGGAQVTKTFLQSKLADDIIISIMPILIGNGILFFDYIGLEQPLHLKEVTAYKDGIVELWYEII